jgi:hypothetical protein
MEATLVQFVLENISPLFEIGLRPERKELLFLSLFEKDRWRRGLKAKLKLEI